MVKFLEDLKKRQNDKPKIKPISPLIKTNLETSGPPPLKRSPTGCKDPTYNSTDYDIEGLMSSITRIKDQNLFLRDINQERMQLEASREKDGPAPTKPRLGYVKVPSFAESPKEDKEKERAFSYNKDESESETESETESSTEESSSEEEQKPPPRTTPVRKTAVNSIPAKPSQQRAQLKSESTGSESETETSSEEEAAPTKTPPSTVNSRTPVTRAQSTPSLSSSVTSPTSRQPVTTGGSRALKSPFLDQDKKGPASPTTPTTPSRTFGSRFADREEKKEPSSQFGFPTRTTAATTTTNSTTSSIRDRFGSRSSATTTTATTDSTTSSVRDRLGSRSSQDEKEPPSSAGGRKARKVTKRAGTAFVGSIDNDDEEEEEEQEKSNDLDSAKTTEPASNAGTTDRISRTRLGATSADRDKKEPEADTFTTRRSRLQDQNKENEEGEVSSWRRKRLEREREREKEKEKAEVPSYRRNRFQDAEKEREQRKVRESERLEKEKQERETKERELLTLRAKQERETNEREERRQKLKENLDTQEKDSDDSIGSMTAQSRVRRQRRLRENRRSTGVAYMPTDEAEDDSTAEARAAKRNTKVNEEAEERPSYRRSRLPERGDTESSASDRSKGSRGTDTTARDTRQAPATVTAQTNIQVTETDPIKLREKLQEALIEVQQYKVKLEQAMQEPTSHAGTTDRTSRTRLGATSADRDKKEPEADRFTTRRSRLQDQNKENEEGEVSSWRRKRLEREREREKEKEKAEVPSYRRNRFQDAEKEREQRKVRESERLEKEKQERETKERELLTLRAKQERETNEREERRQKLKENLDTQEKDSDDSIGSMTAQSRVRRQRRLRENRRSTGVAYMPTDEAEDDSTAEARAAKRNTKVNEEVEERPSYRRSRLPDRGDTESSDKEKLERKLSSFSEDMKPYIQSSCGNFGELKFPKNKRETDSEIYVANKHGRYIIAYGLAIPMLVEYV
ncbi:predicted protein [Nematostella vectensis]|uniref:Uncharacterized protein n=1 Tax=Nematostella vectensis TaxID=45351 RepID=A7RXV9_NEMVE|nr:predicted protein [Nematostella vectensis]|eukprot:XP_001635754.1 predicted protein [Nematostella vectensis]